MSSHRHSPSIVFRSTPRTSWTTHPATTLNHIMVCSLLGDNPVKSATNTLPSALCFTSNVNTKRVRWCFDELDKLTIHTDAVSEAATKKAVRPGNAACHFLPLNVSKDCLSVDTIMFPRSINHCRSCPQPPHDESEQLCDGSLSVNRDLQGRKIYFTKSKTLVSRPTDRPTVTRVTLLARPKRKKRKGEKKIPQIGTYSTRRHKKLICSIEMLQEIVQQLRKKSDFEHPSK